MANIYKGTIELIGNTPLVEAVNLEQAHDLQATLLIKLEYLNPAGSVKDRIEIFQFAQQRCLQLFFLLGVGQFQQGSMSD